MLFSGLRNAYDFAYNLARRGVHVRQRHGMGRQLAVVPRGRTKHMIPGGDGGYRNGTGKFQDSTSISCRRFVISAAGRRSASRPTRATPIRRGSSTCCSRPTGRAAACSTRRSRRMARTYSGREDLAEFVHGEPMPIADVEVGPDGNLYFTTGGNGRHGRPVQSESGPARSRPSRT